MINRHYNYPHKELWDGKLWQDHVSYMNGLAQWLGEHTPKNENP